jgi:hypothetical protein
MGQLSFVTTAIRKGTEMVIALVGNISEGFYPVGPFEDFDAAQKLLDNANVEWWGMTIISPEDF